MLRIKLGPGYEQIYRNLVQDDQLPRDHIAELVSLFRKNPKDTRLDNHALTKKMEGKWAFSITDDMRIVYEWIGSNTVRFLDIGPHDTVYPKPKVSKNNLQSVEFIP